MKQNRQAHTSDDLGDQGAIGQAACLETSDRSMEDGAHGSIFSFSLSSRLLLIFDVQYGGIAVQ